MRTKFLSIAAAIALAVSAMPAQAALIQKVWHGVPFIQFSPDDATITAEQAWAAGTAPAYTFTNTNTGFHYNASAGTIAGFFAADAAGAALSDGSATQSFAFDASGYIVSTGGSYTFDFGNVFNRDDDAARLTIDGVIVAEQHFDNGSPLAVPSSVTLSLAAGYHAFDLFYFQTIGGWGLDLFSSGPGGAPVVYSTTVPAPGALLLLGMGLAGLGAARRRKA